MGSRVGGLTILGTVTVLNVPSTSSTSHKDTTPNVEDTLLALQTLSLHLSFSFPSYLFLLGDNFLVSHFFS